MKIPVFFKIYIKAFPEMGSAVVTFKAQKGPKKDLDIYAEFAEKDDETNRDIVLCICLSQKK